MAIEVFITAKLSTFKYSFYNIECFSNCNNTHSGHHGHCNTSSNWYFARCISTNNSNHTGHKNNRHILNNAGCNCTRDINTSSSFITGHNSKCFIDNDNWKHNNNPEKTEANHYGAAL